jgi:HEXXH motif-containing protein
MSEVLYRQLSCPQEASSARIPETIAETYASEVTRLFLDAHGNRIAERSEGLCELVREWLDRGPDFETAWAPVVASLRHALLSERVDPVAPAAELGLRIASIAGIPCEWRALVDGGRRLEWGDAVLPPARSVAVSAQDGRAELELTDDGGARTLAFVRAGEGWEGEGGERPPSIRSGEARLALIDRRLAPPGFPGPEAADLVADEVDGGITRACEEALDLLLEHTPHYHAWVRRVVRKILVLRDRPGRLSSGSASDVPGSVYLSLPNEAVAVGEMLVHESSHEYFHLLTRVEPVDDGSDTTLYYSPPMRRDRPLDRILVAYHAFANVAFYYAACAEHDIHATYTSERRMPLIPMLRTLEEPLRGNPALTATGRALVEPLVERLRPLLAE